MLVDRRPAITHFIRDSVSLWPRCVSPPKQNLKSTGAPGNALSEERDKQGERFKHIAVYSLPREGPSRPPFSTTSATLRQRRSPESDALNTRIDRNAEPFVASDPNNKKNTT